MRYKRFCLLNESKLPARRGAAHQVCAIDHASCCMNVTCGAVIQAWPDMETPLPFKAPASGTAFARCILRAACRLGAGAPRPVFPSAVLAGLSERALVRARCLRRRACLPSCPPVWSGLPGLSPLLLLHVCMRVCACVLGVQACVGGGACSLVGSCAGSSPCFVLLPLWLCVLGVSARCAWQSAK